MKKVFVLLITVFVIASMVGCSNTPSGRELYNLKLSKYVDLGDYKGIEVDTSSDRFKEYYDAQIESINYHGDEDGRNFVIHITDTPSGRFLPAVCGPASAAF